MKIYLDVCCLCRPFDNQRSSRIRIESTAVWEIIRRCNDEYTLVTSEAVTEEISQIPDIKKRIRVENIVLMAKERILIDEKIITRMHELIQHGGKPMDCLHIACAEKAEALLLTADDNLIKFIKSCQGIQIRVENPEIWLKEMNL